MTLSTLGSYPLIFAHVEQDYFSGPEPLVKVDQNAPVIVDVGGHMGMFTLQCFVRSGLTAKVRYLSDLRVSQCR